MITVLDIIKSWEFCIISKQSIVLLVRTYKKRVDDMKKKIVIAGGTGFIGQYFEEKFTNLGYEVIIISRQPHHLSWTDQAGIVEALEDAEMLINLAGKSVNCRYNEKNKKEILDSRTETTQILGHALLACKNPPPLWINSSYGYDLSTCGRSTYDRSEWRHWNWILR